MSRITARVGDKVVFTDDSYYAALPSNAAVDFLMGHIADLEDKVERDTIMTDYFKVEDFLYGDGKDKPLPIKAAMIWGALMVTLHHGGTSWDDVRNLFGEFMSKQMGLR